MTSDPVFTTALAQLLEGCVNQALKFDPGSRAQLQKLSGTVFAVHINQPRYSLFCLPSDDARLQIFSHWEGETTTALSGNLTNIIGLLSSDTHSLANSGVTVTGKVSLLGDYQTLMSQLDIDWEDALAGIIGELPAHQVAILFSAAGNWLRPRLQRWPEFWSEIISDELQAVPSRPEVEAFNNDVDELRAACDRLEARLNIIIHSTENKL